MSDPEKRKKYDEYGEHWKHADEFEAQKKARQHAGGGGGGFSGFGGDGGSYWYSSDGEGSRVVMPEDSRTSLNLCSDIEEEADEANAGFRGQDFNAELHLSLRDAARTHKQVLNVNGKQVRITIPPV